MLSQRKCSNCGANVQFEGDSKKTVCEYCGAEVALEEVVNNYQTINQYSTTQHVVKNIYGKEELEASESVQKGDVFISLGEFAKAEKLYFDAADKNPADWRAWFGMVKVKTKNFTDLEDKTHLEFLEKAKIVANAEQKEEIKKQYAIYELRLEAEKKRQEKLEEERKIKEIERSKKAEATFKKMLVGIAIAMVLLVVAGFIFERFEKKTYCFGDYGKYVEKYNVESFEIPKGATEIPSWEYSYCRSLKEIVIPEGVTQIGVYAFDGCSSLTKITIPSTVTSIEMAAFRGCSALESVTFDGVSNLTNIGWLAFNNCKALKEIEIPSYVERIDGNAFRECTSLTAVTFAPVSELTEIGDRAFQDCENLREVLIPQKVKNIGEEAFYNCEKIESLSFELGSQLETVGEHAFSSCISLSSVILPKGLKTIESFAFSVCDNLKEVTIPETVESVGADLFLGCDSLENITIPFLGSTITDMENAELDYFFEWKMVVVKPRNLKRVTITKGGNIADYAFANYDGLTEVSIPSSITTIGDSAFSSCDNLTKVNFGENSQLKIIGSKAFDGCSSLKEIIIPNGVTQIKEEAFSNCLALKEIRIPNSVITMGRWVFYRCPSLKIYCQVQSRPSGWDGSWKDSSCTAYWGGW